MLKIALGIQPLLEDDRSGDLIHIVLALGAVHIALDERIGGGDSRQPLILIIHRQACFFKLCAEIFDFFRLEACSAIHVTEPTEQKGKWNELAKGKEIYAEIGCGKGGFICELAARHPDVNFLAVELYANVLVSACETAQKRGLTNIRFLSGNAEYLARFIPPHSIRRLYLNFSTPFPKKRQATHRLTHPHFLEMYKDLLVPGASLIQKTDGRVFFQYSLESLSQCGYTLKEVSLDLHADGIEDNIVTEYESRFVAQGLPIYRVEATI